MVGALRRKLILSFTLAVLVFMISFFALPVYSFAQTKMMNGLRLDTNKDRYTIGENVTLNLVILNDANSTLHISVDMIAVLGRGPFGPTPGWGESIYGDLFSIPPRGEHPFPTTITWPIQHSWVNTPGVYLIGAGLRYSMSDGTIVQTGATVTVLFTVF